MGDRHRFLVAGVERAPLRQLFFTGDDQLPDRVLGVVPVDQSEVVVVGAEDVPRLHRSEPVSLFGGELHHLVQPSNELHPLSGVVRGRDALGLVFTLHRHLQSPTRHGPARARPSTRAPAGGYEDCTPADDTGHGLGPPRTVGSVHPSAVTWRGSDRTLGRAVQYRILGTETQPPVTAQNRPACGPIRCPCSPGGRLRMGRARQRLCSQKVTGTVAC